MTFRLFARHCLQVAVVSLSCETSRLYLDLFVFFSCIVLSSAACSGVAGYIYDILRFCCFVGVFIEGDQEKVFKFSLRPCNFKILILLAATLELRAWRPYMRMRLYVVLCGLAKIGDPLLLAMGFTPGVYGCRI